MGSLTGSEVSCYGLLHFYPPSPIHRQAEVSCYRLPYVNTVYGQPGVGCYGLRHSNLLHPLSLGSRRCVAMGYHALIPHIWAPRGNLRSVAMGYHMPIRFMGRQGSVAMGYCTLISPPPYMVSRKSVAMGYRTPRPLLTSDGVESDPGLLLEALPESQHSLLAVKLRTGRTVHRCAARLRPSASASHRLSMPATGGAGPRSSAAFHWRPGKKWASVIRCLDVTSPDNTALFTCCREKLSKRFLFLEKVLSSVVSSVKFPRRPFCRIPAQYNPKRRRQ